jgi:hypothetical protein
VNVKLAFMAIVLGLALSAGIAIGMSIATGTWPL